jgi:hypothetical protein
MINDTYMQTTTLMTTTGILFHQPSALIRIGRAPITMNNRPEGIIQSGSGTSHGFFKNIPFSLKLQSSQVPFDVSKRAIHPIVQ